MDINILNDNKTLELVKSLFIDENSKPIVLTPTQLQLFNLIFKKASPRNHIMCHTRFGKSFIVGLSVLLRVATFPEKWCIVAPSEKKAKIIMGYIIEHTFDNEYFKTKLQYDETENLDRLRRERSKNRLTYKHSDGRLGEVFVLTADSRNRQSSGDSVMGFGSTNLILDEAALIDDDLEAKIFRMLGDNPKDSFYCKIGNPFNRNHFLHSYKDPSYFKIDANDEVGLKEGRLTPEFIAEVKARPFYDILYANKFPAADAIDSKGWSALITDFEYEASIFPDIPQESWVGSRILGVDIARGGGNYNVWVIRTGNFAKVIARNEDNDLMSVAGTTIRLCKEYKIDFRNVFLDDTGVGGGVVDRLKELGHLINPVINAEAADEELRFVNKRAENHWRAKEWLMKGGKINKDDDWTDLLNLRYRADSSGRLQMMSKVEMRRNGFESPDTSDAFTMTFARNPYNYYQEQMAAKEDNQSYDRYSVL